jgi:hypothetical protein
MDLFCNIIFIEMFVIIFGGVLYEQFFYCFFFLPSLETQKTKWREEEMRNFVYEKKKGQ